MDEYVFVSYASKDRKRVLPIIESIETAGINTWMDKNRIPGGGDYTQEIPAAIGRSLCVIVFLSENAFQSGHVRRELNLSIKKNKPIIPALLDDVRTPENFEYQLEAVQTVELFGRAYNEWWVDLRRALDVQRDKARQSHGVQSVRDSDGSRARQDAFVETPLMPISRRPASAGRAAGDALCAPSR
jgi:hypothetical protein